MKILNSIAEAVGNTPLIKLSRIDGIPAGQTLLVKCEFMNPGGSVKDRIAFRMVEKAEETGQLRPGMLIVEATGGNTGIGLALAARLKNYQLLCVMTEKVGKEKVRMMQILGAEVLVLPGGKAISDANHFINQAKRIARERKGWFVGQFENEENIAAHYETTGPEIWEQTGGTVDALVAGIGTGGTIFGAGKYLKEKKPSVELVLADPEGSCLADWVTNQEPQPGSYLVEGIGGDFIPSIVELSKIDRAIKIRDEDSVRTAHELLDKEALFVGGSAGLIVAGAIEYLRQAKQKKLTVVAVLPSTGRLYTNTIFDQDWLKERLPDLAPNSGV
jgi:cystathionine beta-synthase